MKVKVTAFTLAVTPNPSHQYKLIRFLRAYRDWVQYVVDQIWFSVELPSMKKLHYKFYEILRKQGFRAHHCHKIERRAREVVKGIRKQWIEKLKHEIRDELRIFYGKKKLTKSERKAIEDLAWEIAKYQLNLMIESREFKVSKTHSEKPVLKKLTARLDHQDYKLDVNTKTLKIAVLNNEWVELKLLWYSYLEGYFNSSWRPKEILVSCRDNEVWVYFTFEKEVVLKQPKAIMGVDINFDNITYTIIDTSGKLATIGTIPFNGLKRALVHKIITEEIMMKYPRKWRFTKGIREAIRKHGRRARNILNDSCHYVSRRIVNIAREYDALIVLEDLSKLKTKASGSKRFNKRLSLWAYHRIQSYIYYKALAKELNVAYVNPRRTSKTSPLGGKLTFINYKWAKLPNGHIVTRDIVASWNLALRGLKLYIRDVGSRGSVETPKAPDQMQPQEGMKGKPMFTVYYI